MISESWIGKRIGERYQVEALLGQGGMSAVYRANDPNLRRLVAIKLIHTHLSNDPNFIGRFKEEAAAVARLRHPNIVQVHDFNFDGEIYYMVMEYLVGETLQTRLKRLNKVGRNMPLEEVLQLTIQLCEAAGYAHNHELIHRDIKPANIMLNVNGQAVLMDFGIVKIIGGDHHTATGATIGTAMYMSPEQIRSERVDERADIYSLGVTLYEMISGRPPYMADSALTLMMMVLNDPLPDLAQTRANLPENLLAIVNKALAKNPAERFQTMTEMKESLRRVLADLAGAPAIMYATEVDEPEVEPMTLSSGQTTVLDSQTEDITVGSQVGVQYEPEPSRASQQQPGGGIPSVQTVLDNETEAGPILLAPALSDKRSIVRTRTRRVLLIIASLFILAVAMTAGLLYINSTKPPRFLLASINTPLDPLNAQTAQTAVNLGRWETESYIESLAFSPTGSLLGTANNRERSRFSRYRFYAGLWQVKTGKLQNYLLGHTQWIYDVAISSDGQMIGAVSDDGSLIIWQVSDGRLEKKIETDSGGLTSLAYSPNNLLVATGSWDGIVSLWQVSTGNLLRSLGDQNDSSIIDVDFSPDGRILAAASDDNSILLWRVSDGSLLHTLLGHTAPANAVVFSPDGMLLASASQDNTIKIWQLTDGILQKSILGHTDSVYDVAFSPDGSLLASGSGDGTLSLWQARDGALLNILTESSDSIKSVAFSPDGYLLVSGAVDGVVQFWGISEAIPAEEK